MKRILCIDDEPAVLKSLRKALKREGYEVLVTDDPLEGLRILREEERLDLVTLDIKMPEKNGFDLYREMRSFRKLPVLFATAYPRSFNLESESVVKMWETEFSDGTTDIIYKPFDLQVLFDKVEALIGGPNSPAPDASHGNTD